MVQMKDQRIRFFNKNQKKNAACTRRGFLYNSKILKSMNLTKQIIQRPGKNRTIFYRRVKSEVKDE
jgi:hypothetical protein